MRRPLRVAWLVTGSLVVIVPAARAQAPAMPLHRLEIAVGGGLFAGSSLGEAPGELRANSLTPTAYRLFNADFRFVSAPVLEARLGTALSRRFAIEGTFSFARPDLRASITSDAEGAPAIDIVERVDQYLVDAGLVVVIDELRVGGLVPVVGAGAGYLRQLHEGLTLIEHGHFFHAGAGVRYLLFSRSRGLLKGAGIRADARLLLLEGGIHVSDDRPARRSAVSGGLFVVF